MVYNPAMEKQLPYARPLFGLLSAFALTAVASIALQNLVWAAVALFFYAHWKNRLKIGWPTGSFPLATLLFLATFFLGALVGIDPANSFHTVHKYLTLLMIFPIGAMGLDPREIRKLLLLFVYGAAFCAFFGIGKHFFLNYDRIDSFSGDKMVFGGMLMAALLVGVLLLARSPRDPWLWVCLALMAWALVLTETRGAWIGFVAGFIILCWRLNRRWLLTGLLLLGASYFVLPASIQDRVKSIGDLRVSYGPQHEIVGADQPRFLIWSAGWRIIQDHPWGVGQGNIEKIFPRYNPPALARHEPTEPHLHDNFLQLCGQNGWIGLLAYLFWIFGYYWDALRFKPAQGESAEWNWVFLSVFSAVLVWGLTEYTLSHQFMNVQFFLLGLQANLWRAGKKAAPSPSTGNAPGSRARRSRPSK